jgi:predicted transcriptional regulator of viral defense system
MNNSPITLAQAASLAVAKYDRPVITNYRLGVMVFQLIKAGRIDGKTLNRLGPPSRRHFRQALNFLANYAVLSELRDLPRESAFTVLGRSSVSTAEIACTVDPFAYVSHLSAMELHGLTDRVTQTLYLSSPDPKAWKVHAAEMMQRDLDEERATYEEAGFPLLQRTRIEKLMGTTVRITHSAHLGAFRKTPDSEVRVATIGRTFLDMLREPTLCGGIHHVLGIYREHAERNLALIVAEVDQHGGPIDKVRAGYVLEELCGLKHPSITEWQTHAARGGSRKLVAANEYASTYSERWALSLNAD